MTIFLAVGCVFFISYSVYLIYKVVKYGVV